jgi:hypothetical protein
MESWCDVLDSPAMAAAFVDFRLGLAATGTDGAFSRHGLVRLRSVMELNDGDLEWMNLIARRNGRKLLCCVNSLLAFVLFDL